VNKISDKTPNILFELILENTSNIFSIGTLEFKDVTKLLYCRDNNIASVGQVNMVTTTYKKSIPLLELI
jgi:hypothetical protein